MAKSHRHVGFVGKASASRYPGGMFTEGQDWSQRESRKYNGAHSSLGNGQDKLYVISCSAYKLMVYR